MNTRFPRELAAGLVAMVLVVLTSCGDGSSGRTQDETSSTIAGVVLVAPSCPVVRVDEPCPPARARNVPVEVRVGGEVVASGMTDARGRFRLTSPTGIVEVYAGNPGGLPAQASRRVHVPAGATASVRLTLDSGIR